MKLDRRLALTGAASALAALAFATPAFGAANAAASVARERTLAASQGKHVLLSFFASWCAWCRPMHAFLEDPAVQRILGARFRIVHLRVMEVREQLRAQQLPGADEFMLSYVHPSAGLPFLAFLDNEGRATSTTLSRDDGRNIGFPTESADLDTFDAMIARACPGITAQERAAVRAACVRARS